MSTSQDIGRLELELDSQKRDLREDASKIRDKIDETKAQLNPTNWVRKRPLLLSGAALLLGFSFGYLLDLRKLPAEEAAQPAVEHLGKPFARGLLTKAGKEVATQAIRGTVARISNRKNRY
jgi:hypothetical protein